MVDALQNLQVVYAKWEQRNPCMQVSKQNESLNGQRSWWPANRSAPSVPFCRSSRSSGRSRRDFGFRESDTLSVDVRNLAWFKSQPVALPAALNRRPFPGRCCECMPESRNSVFHNGLRSAGLHNILDVETKYGQNNWWTRTFCDVSFVMSCKLTHQYPDVSLAVLTSPRIIEAVQAALRADSVESGCQPALEKRHQKRAQSLLRRMSAQISNRFTRFTGWFLHKFLGRLLSSILVHKGQMFMLQQACKSGLPVVFLPTHRSHFDYILITFILFHHEISNPHVAAGDNLIIPIFGAFMRGLGGFFIRRKLDRVSGRKDYVYRAVLQTYMEELLRQGEFLEFFIEGQRTRSGKAVYPKAGLLSVVVDTLKNDVVDDVLIVPVSISYDRLVDGNFTKEQMGEPKVYETFWRATLAIYHTLMGHYGSVRVDFSQAFSLKEYMKAYKFFPDSGGSKSPCESVYDDENSSQCNTVIHRISDSSMDLVSGDARHMVQSIAEHVIYNSVKVQSAMSSHLLALLLLNSHRQGVAVRDLIKSFDSLKQEILCRDHDVSFAGETIDVIAHALSMLGSRLIKMEPSVDISLLDDEQLSLVKVVPVTTLPLVFELSYYANIISPVFALESVVANVLFSSIEREQWLNMARDSLMSVSKNQVIAQAVELCSILKYEYIFAPPCRSLDLAVNDALERFHNADVLLTSEQLELSDECNENIEDQLWAKRVASRLDCGFDDSDNEDDWSAPDAIYILNANKEFLDKLWFLKGVLSPVLETYYVAACRLTVLLEQDVLESVYVSSLHSLLKSRVVSGVTSCAESAALDTVKNTVYSFRNLRVVDCYEVAGVRMLTLVKPYSDESVLNSFIRHLESYRE